MTDATHPEADALARDAADPLTAVRDRFRLPTSPTRPGGPAPIYFAGQSLGLQPRSVGAAVAAELDRWAEHGVDAFFEGDRPWFTLDDALREPLARIVGARPAEVALLNTLTVNLHLLLTSFLRPVGRRRRILADGPLFPSDRHALTSTSPRVGWTRRRTWSSSSHGRVRPSSGPATSRPRSPSTARTSPCCSWAASTSRPARRSTSSG